MKKFIVITILFLVSCFCNVVYLESNRCFLATPGNLTINNNLKDSISESTVTILLPANSEKIFKSLIEDLQEELPEQIIEIYKKRNYFLPDDVVIYLKEKSKDNRTIYKFINLYEMYASQKLGMQEIIKHDIRRLDSYKRIVERLKLKRRISWELVHPLIQRELILQAMEEFPFGADLFYKPLKYLDGAHLRVLYNFYLKQEEGMQKKRKRFSVLNRIRDKLEIADIGGGLTYNQILSRFRSGKRISWRWVSAEVQRKLLEELAKGIGESIDNLDSSWLMARKGYEDKIRKIKKFHGRTFTGYYSYYQDLYKGFKGGLIIDIIRIRIGIGMKQYTLNELLKGLRTGKIKVFRWRYVPDDVKKEIFEKIAKKHTIPPAAVTTIHLGEGLEGHNVRGILDDYIKKGYSERDGLLQLKKDIGIPSLDVEYILKCFEEDKRIYWNGVYSNEVIRKLIEMLADALGKLPSKLHSGDFAKRVPVFFNHSIGELMYIYRSPSGKFTNKEVDNLLREIGLKKIKQYTYEDFLKALESGRLIYWAHMTSDDRTKVIWYIANKLNKEPTELRSVDFENTKILGRDTHRLLWVYAAEKEVEYSEAFKMMLKEYGFYNELLLRDINERIANIRSNFNKPVKRKKDWERLKPYITDAIDLYLGPQLIIPLFKLLFSTIPDESSMRHAILDYVDTIDHSDSVRHLIDFIAHIGQGDYELWKKAKAVLNNTFGQKSIEKIRHEPEKDKNRSL